MEDETYDAQVSLVSREPVHVADVPLSRGDSQHAGEPVAASLAAD
ncbi:MAG: hypothetical protein QOE71_997 [Pseudonocardiales bacterium]|nr:hypothetical protein [Pseudonocardiales bacterium]